MRTTYCSQNFEHDTLSLLGLAILWGQDWWWDCKNEGFLVNPAPFRFMESKLRWWQVVYEGKVDNACYKNCWELWKGRERGGNGECRPLSKFVCGTAGSFRWGKPYPSHFICLEILLKRSNTALLLCVLHKSNGSEQCLYPSKRRDLICN